MIVDWFLDLIYDMLIGLRNIMPAVEPFPLSTFFGYMRISDLFLPSNTISWILGIELSIILSIWGVKWGKYVINLVRGSGS